jgi:hypothetical protein
MFAAPLSAYKFMLWPVIFLAFLGTIRRRMCLRLFAARAFLRDPEAAKVAIVAFVNRRADLGDATLVAHSC